MKELYKKNREIDPVTLIDALVREGVYDKAGGTEYIKVIAKTVPTAANIVDYAKIVKDKSTLRAMISVCESISEEAYTEAGEVEYLLNAGSSASLRSPSGANPRTLRRSATSCRASTQTSN